MKIKLQGIIGQCDCRLELQPRESQMQNIMELAGKNLLYHPSASGLFGEKSDFTRDSQFSPELSAACEAQIRKQFGDYFQIENLEIIAAPSKAEKKLASLQRQLKSLDFGDEKIAEILAGAKEKLGAE